jgi:hypothetical protein
MASGRRYVNMTFLAQVSRPDNSAGSFGRRRRQTQILPTYPDQRTRPRSTPRWHFRQTTYISTDENPWSDSHGNWIPEITLTRIPQSPGTAGDL